MRRPAYQLLCLALTTAAAAQTRVELPLEVGTVTVPSEWTVLAGADLTAGDRPTDPTAEPARSIVQGMARLLTKDERTERNMLLHAPGMAPGQVRTINTYSDGLATTSADLATDRQINQIQRNYEEVVAAPDQKIVRLGHRQPDLFEIGCVAVKFRLEFPERKLITELYVVPAGNRLQYFEVQYSADDLDAPTMIEAVLRTFDGAREEPDDTLSKMVIGGIAGGLAGVAAALFRRRRHERIHRAANAQVNSKT